MYDQHASTPVGLAASAKLNDDQSLSPVTPLVSLLFLSFLIPEMFRNIFNLLVLLGVTIVTTTAVVS